jgi:uncharacterized membrane protein
MALMSASVAAYALGLLLVPAVRPPFLGERFMAHPVATPFHLGASAVALAVGPLQFLSRIRARFPDVHRWLGRAYVTGIALGGVGGLMLAPVSQGGLPAHLGFGSLACAWLLVTARAFERIRARDVAAHQRWMIRSFALTFAAVTLRIYLPVGIVLEVPYEPAYQAIAWLCWVPNLLVAEWLIARRQPRRVREAPVTA